MGRLIQPELASHWYTKDGVPCHEVPNASRGGMRPTTITDARRLGLLPSVTNILQILAKPNVAAWKNEHFARAGYVAGKIGHYPGDFATEEERDEATIRAAVGVAEETMSSAARRGTLYHAVISDLIRSVESQMEVEWGYLANFPGETNPETIAAFLGWYRGHCLNGTSEKPFASPDGYGGCVDWYGFYRDDLADEPEFAVIDFKTQGTKEGKPVRSYSEWAVQLAAYANGIGVGNARLINLVISTTEPGRIEVVEWPEGVEFWYQNFLRVFAVWRGALGRNYDPRGE